MFLVLFLFLGFIFFFFIAFVLDRILFTGKELYSLLFIICFLPFYGNFLVFAYQQTGSKEVVTLLQLSKELVLGLMLLVYIFYNKNILTQRFRLGTLDIVFLSFLGLSTLFLFLPIGNPSFISRLIYYKNIFFLCFIYFIGRNSQLPQATIIKGLQIILLIGAIAFVVAGFEKATNTHLHSRIDLTGFNEDIRDKDPQGAYGLTWTFQAQDGRKRFGSVFANPLEFAATTLLTFSVGLILLVTSRIKENQLLYITSIFASILSLMMAYSRSSMVAFLMMLFFIAIVFRFYRLILLGGILVFGLVVYLLYFASQETQFYVIDTITFENPSSLGHAIEWFEAVDSMISSPQGIGLAMSGNAGGVNNETKVGGENQFLIFGVQLGIIGMFLYIWMLLGGIWFALKTFRRARNWDERIIPFIASTVKFGLLLPLFTANSELYLFLSFCTWWMVGYTVSIYYKQKEEIYATKRALGFQ